MSFCKIVTDPLQNHILLDDGLTAANRLANRIDLDEAEDAILHPSYMINGGGEGIYYFKYIGNDTNLLIEARLKDEIMVVEALVVNPSIDYISKLLKEGNLIRFPLS